MVECYLCKGKLRVTRDKHVYDEKLKRRYHFKCFAGICRKCDMPVYAKAKHKVIGANIWHDKCYRDMHRKNPIETIDEASWKAMVAARKAADIPRKLWREFEADWFQEHPPKFEKNPRHRQLKTPPPPPRERSLKLPPSPPPFRKLLKQKNPHRAPYKTAKEDKDWAANMPIQLKVAKDSEEAHRLIDKYRGKRSRMKNPTLITPDQEMDIMEAFRRVIGGGGTEADKKLVRAAREADVIMSTGPSVLMKRNPPERTPVESHKEVDYVIQDEFGTTFETGHGTREQAEARALHYNKKHMRSFNVIYPGAESPAVKKAAKKATEEMLKS